MSSKINPFRSFVSYFLVFFGISFLSLVVPSAGKHRTNEMAKSFQQTRKPKSQKKKNKNKGVQDGGVHKPKEVKTNLKHINLSNKMKTEAVDSQFNQLKEEMMGGVKTEVKSKKKVKGAPSDVKMEDCKYPVANETNVKYESTDVTMETTIVEMGKLGAGNT